MNKKLYYFTPVPPSEKGISASAKVFEHKRLFEKAGFSVEVVNSLSWKQRLKNRLNISKVENFLNYHHVLDNSCLYIRYNINDNFLFKQLKEIKKNKKNIKIAVEIPTYPYDGELKSHHFIKKIHNNVRLAKDRSIREELFKYVDRIVTFSDDKKIWNIKTINISNSVNTEKITRRKITLENDKSINLIAVASIRFWHGYDRLIRGLGEYYRKESNPRKIKLFIIGDGEKEVLQSYKKLIKSYGLEDKVIMTGPKLGGALDKYYNLCNLGVDTLGRFRTGVNYNSTLKGKEYLAKGLPIISGVKTELDNRKDFKYYYRVPADNTPINIENIINFYDKVYRDQKEEQVANEIRKFCENNYNFDINFQPVIEWYKRD